MKDLLKFKARIAPLLGIVAIVTVMGLVSCKDEEPAAAPPDAIFYLSADYGAYPNYPISATVIDLKIPGMEPLPFPKTAPSHSTNISANTDTVVIFWAKAADAIYTNWLEVKNGTKTESEYTAWITALSPTGDTNSFTNHVENDLNNTSTHGRLFKPNGTGNYVAGIVDSQAYKAWANSTGAKPPFPMPSFSKVIPVGPVPTDAAFQAKQEFLGKWTMSKNYAWVANNAPAGTTQSREIVKIGPDTFRIFLNQPWGEKGNEGIQFAVTSWQPLTGTALTKTKVPDPDTGAEQSGSITFLKGFNLTIGEVLLNQGYTDYTKFSVFQDTSSRKYLARGNQGDTIVRSYLTQTKPTDDGIMTEDWAVTGDSTYGIE